MPVPGLRKLELRTRNKVLPGPREAAEATDRSGRLDLHKVCKLWRRRSCFRVSVLTSSTGCPRNPRRREEGKPRSTRPISRLRKTGYSEKKHSQNQHELVVHWVQHVPACSVRCDRLNRHLPAGHRVSETTGLVPLQPESLPRRCQTTCDIAAGCEEPRMRGVDAYRATRDASRA